MGRAAVLGLLASAMAACGGGTTSGTPNTAGSAVPSGGASASAPAAQPTKSQYLAGTAAPVFPAGSPNQLAVVAQAGLTLPVPSGGEPVPIAVRNNTTRTVTHVTASGTVHDSTGKPVATGSDQGFHPALLEPGQFALGFIYLGVGTSVPSGSTLSVQATATPSAGPNTYFADLLVTEVNDTGQQIVGTVKNPRDHAVTAPYSVDVFCVDSSGTLLNEFGGFADVSTDLAAGGTSPFTVSLYGSQCAQFLIGASGYDMTAAGN